MNTQLVKDIRSQIISAINSNDVYYYDLPNESYLDRLTVTFQVSNTSNENTFDAKEVEKVYSIRININAPNHSYFDTDSIYILKSSIYKLNQINSNVRYVALTSEDLFFDEELNIWTEFLEFEVHYS